MFKNRKYNIILILIFFTSTTNIFPQFESIRTKIAQKINDSNGNVGVAIMDFATKDILTINNDFCYPMQSVYKFPLAISVLNKLNEDTLSFNEVLYITKNELHPKTWSPLREKYPNGNTNISFTELLKYTVAASDNNGCDILFKFVGGPLYVDKFIKSLGIKNISILSTEKEMHQDWSIQYKNCSTPLAMVNLLYKFYHGNILSEKNRDFLLDIMALDLYNSKRIKGELPNMTIVAHKTGTSGKNDKGITAATNDVGIVTLPNGNQFGIVVFVSDSPDNDKTRDKLIASITKIVWEFYNGK